jgi:hypothetical protein
MEIPNAPNTPMSPRILLQSAKTWLQEHSDESMTTASRIFNIHRKTLESSIRRQQKKAAIRGGHNRILSPGQEESINR